MNFEKRLDIPLHFPKAFEKAEELRKKYEINPEEFEHYDKASVAKDQLKVKSLLAKWNEGKKPEDIEHDKLAEIFEMLLFQVGEMQDWFGEDAITTKTSRYDDLVNGIDMFIEFIKEEGSSFLGLGIDITYSQSLGKKVQRIKDDILSGKLGYIKYFRSDEQSMKGEKSNIPRVVAGVDSNTVRVLASLWVSDKKEDRDKLKNHPVKWYFLEQIIFQCEKVIEYIEKQDDSVITKKIKAEMLFRYGSILGIVSGIFKNHPKDYLLDLENSLGYIDGFFGRLKDSLEYGLR